MRRRPMEFWLIAAYCAARGVLVLTDIYRDAALAHYAGPGQAAMIAFGLAFFCIPGLLLFFQPAGRWLGAAVLALDAADVSRGMAESAEAGRGIDWRAALTFVLCAWMCVYLLRPSTSRWFKTRSVQGRKVAPVVFAPRFDLLFLLEVSIALLTAWGARQLGASAGMALSAGITLYALYCVFLEERLRQRWDSFFARIEPGFPEDQARNWRAACGALARNDLSAARRHFQRMTDEARSHSSGRLFEMALNWHAALSGIPINGTEILRRAVFDHVYKPNADERVRAAQFVEISDEIELRNLASERAELIAALTRAASNPASFFRARADRMLSRITGEAFAFSVPESWAAWWIERRAHWTGDAGPAAIVARLLCCKCHAAAVAAARKIAGRAEEPLLTAMTLQMAFFNAMREAVHGSGAPAAFSSNPLQVLLVPDWADAAGWLHADSPILANLGIVPRTIARRLALRARMLDYASEFSRRFPADLNDDLHWVLPLLSGKSFGVLRAHVKFDAWWPAARPFFVRHAQATNAGLAAFASGDYSGAERHFEAVLDERPNDLSARYNLSLCRMKSGDMGGAERFLLELTAMEPKEPYWWMALGDLHRSTANAMKARASYRHAQQLGASEGRVALHLGLTFAHESRDGEAMRLFARALGKNPSASKLESLAMQLESEGCWKLAGHYREEALKKELDGPESQGNSDRGDESAV